MPQKLEIKGVEELKRTLDKIGEAFEMKGRAAERIKDMMMKPANDMRRAAQSMAPVATGALRGSIKAAPMLERPGAIVWQDGSEADYGRYVEWGTSNMAAQPFMRPAVEATRSTFASALASDIPDILEEAAAQTRWKAK